MKKRIFSGKKIELEEDPAFELQLLASIYEERGLKKETALLVAKELTEKDALAAHVRDELGISSTSKANPLQAALASGASFVFGGVLPLMVVILVALNSVIYVLYATTIIALLILGATSAKIGGAGWIKAALRVSILGTIAMGFSAFVGYLFGINV